MKYIIFTFEGEGLPIAKKLLDEGQEVLVGMVENKKDVLTSQEKTSGDHQLSIEEKRRLLLYKNIIPLFPAHELIKIMSKINKPEDYFVFFDFNTLFNFSDKVLAMGFTIGNFPTEKDRLFEIDRDAAKNFVKKYYPKVKIAEKKEFRTVNSAKDFLRNTNLIWVLKGKTRSGPTFIPETRDIELAKWQVIETMDAFKILYEESGFILERKINSAIEITPEKLFYDGVPVALCLDFENKPLGCGNLSLQTGCAADLNFPINMNNKINEIAFPSIVDKLAQEHKGLFIWDCCLLIEENTGDIYFGEFCPNRFRYNSVFAYLSQMPSVSYFFEKIVQKKNPFILGSIGSSITIFNLYRDSNERYLLPDASVNYTKDYEKDIWPWDVYKKKKNDKMRIVGYDWQLCPITGAGKSIRETVDKLFCNVENFSLAGAYFRPKFDFLSLDYPSSILNRLQYGLNKKLYKLPFTFPENK